MSGSSLACASIVTGDYPGFVRLSLADLRRRMSLVAVVVLLVVCVGAVGVGCACVSGHPPNAIEQVAGALSAAVVPPVVVWGALLVLLGASLMVSGRRVVAFGRASPAELQRFRF
jgi:cytochrome bd-type quinol oxidase subunit 2